MVRPSVHFTVFFRIKNDLICRYLHVSKKKKTIRSLFSVGTDRFDGKKKKKLNRRMPSAAGGPNLMATGSRVIRHLNTDMTFYYILLFPFRRNIFLGNCRFFQLKKTLFLLKPFSADVCIRTRRNQNNLYPHATVEVYIRIFP